MVFSAFAEGRRQWVFWGVLQRILVVRQPDSDLAIAPGRVRVEISPKS